MMPGEPVMITVVLFAATLAAPAPPARGARPAGVYFEQTTLVRQPGVPTGPGVRTRAWCVGSSMRLEAADQPGGPAFLLRLDEGRALRIDPDARLATELDVARLRARSHADAAAAAGLMGAPDERLRRSPLSVRRTIAGHRCRGFRLSSDTLEVEAWVAADLPLRADVFAEFVEWSGAAQALPALVAAIRELPGFPLETRIRLRVLGQEQETVSTVTLVRVLQIPDERFEVPRGFRIVKEASSQEESR
jgi:hypothetical protein